MMENGLQFMDAAHEASYCKAVSDLETLGPYSEVIVYLLTAHGETRSRFNEIYDPENQCVRPECRNNCWSAMARLLIDAAASLSGSPNAPVISRKTLWPVLRTAFRRVNDWELVM